MDPPAVVGGIGGQIPGILSAGQHTAAQEGTKIGEVGFIEGQGILGEHDLAVDRVSGRGHARAIAPEVFLLFLLAFLRLCLSGRRAGRCG